MIVKNNSEKLISSLSTLADNICEIYYVDLDADTYEPVRTCKCNILFSQSSGKGFFEALLQNSENGLIHPADSEKYRSAFTPESLKKAISEDGLFFISFRIKSSGVYMSFTVEFRKAKNVQGNICYLFVRGNDRYSLSECEGKRKLTLAEDICTVAVAKDLLYVGTCCVRYNESGKITGAVYDECFRSLLGYEKNDSIPDFLDLVHPTDKDNAENNIINAINDINYDDIVDIEIRLRTKSGDYHWFHYVGEAFSENGKRQSFIGVIVDISKKVENANILDSMTAFNKNLETRLEAEHEKTMLIEALGKIYYRIFHIDLKTNKIRTINLRDDVGGKIDELGDAQLMMNKVCDEMVVPDHRADVKLFSDLSTLCDRMGSDKIISNEYLTNKLGWCRSQFIVASTDENGNILSVLFVCRQIDSEKAENDKVAGVIRALSSEYQSVYVVDLKTAETRSYRMSDQITGQFGNSFYAGNYEKNMRTYIEGAVIDEDKPLFDFMTTKEGLEKALSDKDRFRFNYRVRRNGQLSYYLCQAIRVSESSSEIILGFKNVDESIRQDIIQREKIREALEKAENALESERKERNMLHSVANVYHTMHMFNFKERTLETVRSLIEIRDFDYSGADQKKDVQDIIHGVMYHVVKDEHLQIMLDFTDFSSLSDRMKDKNVISQEFNGKLSGWIRASFIAVKREKNEIIECLFVTQIINDEKRREEHLIRISKTDQLTGLGNRRAYEDDIVKLDNDHPPEELAIISLDLNSLKQTNDTYGHAVGDELIKGAADCLKKAFGEVGKVYRTGGDEFVAVVKCDVAKLKSCVENLNRITSSWHGETASNLTISKGYATGREFPDFSVNELEKKADQRMYQDKEAYYRNVDSDRRGK